MYRRQIVVIGLICTCLTILHGCDPILEERKRNGLEVEPFAPREYIRVQRNFTDELQKWADEMEQVEDAVLVQHRKNVYVGIISTEEIGTETQQSVGQLLTEWLNHPDVEQVYVTYDANQTKLLVDNPDLTEEQITQYNWILLGSTHDG